MNKKDLVAAMSEETGMTKKTAQAVLDEFMKIVQKELSAGRKISLPGFGSFYTKRRQARACRNPQTGEKMFIPSCMVAKFRPGKQLVEIVSKK